MPISLPPYEDCNARTGHLWDQFEIANETLAGYMKNIDVNGYKAMTEYMENERKVIFRCGFESFRGQSINRSTNHTNGSMASTLELAALHYRRDLMVVQPDQPIPQGWESMQSLVRIGMQLFTIIDSIFVA